MKSLTVRLPHKEYPIIIENNLFENIEKVLLPYIQDKKVAVVTDENVYALYGEELIIKLKSFNIDTFPIVVKPGEESKSLQTLSSLYDHFIAAGITKSDMIIALGGGVVGDLTGFAAATYLREVPFIQIPTTLLAQVDSSVGGKTAVNVPQGKNLIGSFYHPNAVLIDPLVLKTLPPRYLSDGLAEVIKYGCIKDSSLFTLLQNNDLNTIYSHMEDIIYTCCNIKREVVEEDEHDNGIRMILNFGHTIGHAIEKVYDFSKYTHGEGVAIGMHQITLKSEEMNLTVKGCSEKLKKLLIQYNLPYLMPDASKNDLIKAMGADKKSRGKNISLILLKDIGESFIHKISKNEMELYLEGGN